MVEWLAGNRIRGTNTERTTGAGFNPVPAGVNGIGGWVELGRTTLESAGDNIDVSSLSDKRYYMVLHDVKPSGSVWTENTFNNDITGGNTANRRSVDGGTDALQTSANYIYTSASQTTPMFGVYNIANLAGKEKLQIYHNVMGNTAGAGTAPRRYEASGKWDNTSNPISTFNLHNGNASGDFGIGSEAVVLGWDPTDTHTTNFWEELASVDLSGGAANNIDSGTITAKKYLWVQYYTEQSTDSDFLITFNGDDSSGNYARRYSNDGGTDITSGTSQNNFTQVSRTANLPQFTNMFIINNSANEKLIIAHTVYQMTAGEETAPARWEAVGKWDNTSEQITSMNIKSGSGNLASKTILKVWGSD
tara:strand:+ start:10 stop:1095 length:1086 start_codon:yes stop_codon:yes gene_type:complete